MNSMRQYTNRKQTAKLIELGFERPKFEVETQLVSIHGKPIGTATIIGDYSIGELIEMLQTVKHSCLLIYNLGFDHRKVVFKKLKGRWEYKYRGIGDELIDLLFDAILKLKEDGVI